MDIRTMAAVADKEQTGMLESLTPTQLFFVSIGLLALAVVMQTANKKFYKDDAILLWMGSFICGIAGVLGLYSSLFGG